MERMKLFRRRVTLEGGRGEAAARVEWGVEVLPSEGDIFCGKGVGWGWDWVGGGVERGLLFSVPDWVPGGGSEGLRGVSKATHGR